MMATFSNDDTFLGRPTPTRVLFSNVSFVAIRFLFVKLCEIELKNICGDFFCQAIVQPQRQGLGVGLLKTVSCKSSRRLEISNSFKHPLMNMVNLYVSIFGKQV